MAQHYGYGGGDGEQELVKAFNDVSDAAESDAVSAIRTKYFQLGDILEIACARGYTKSLGVRGWCATNLKVSYTHAQNCRNAYKVRHDFDVAYEWYKQGNTGARVAKTSGPLFAIQVVKAWKLRNDLPTTKQKPVSRAKAAADMANKWKARYERLRSEHVRLAERMPGWEPLVLQAIEHEIAEEEGTALPIASQPRLTPTPVAADGGPVENAEADASNDVPGPERRPASAEHRSESTTVPAPPQDEAAPAAVRATKARRASRQKDKPPSTPSPTTPTTSDLSASHILTSRPPPVGSKLVFEGDV